jgi:hypothetical protein
MDGGDFFFIGDVCTTMCMYFSHRTVHLKMAKMVNFVMHTVIVWT